MGVFLLWIWRYSPLFLMLFVCVWDLEMYIRLVFYSGQWHIKLVGTMRESKDHCWIREVDVVGDNCFLLSKSRSTHVDFLVYRPFRYVRKFPHKHQNVHLKVIKFNNLFMNC